MSEEGVEEEAVKIPSIEGVKALLRKHRDERENSATTPKRLEVRRAINEAGHDFFERMHNANKELGYIAGEFMALNEEYVLNHQGEEETNATVDILQAGFTTNQKSVLERLRDMQIKQSGETIKIKAEITDGKGYHKILFLECNVKMRDKAIEVVERFLRCGLSKIGN